MGRTACAVTSCTHCRLDVPPGRLRPGAPHQFCCAGCEAVFELIGDQGLDRFYRLRDETAAEATFPQPRPTGRSYEAFDDPAFQRLHVNPVAAGLEATLYLEGVHCAACVWLIERLPRAVPGVLDARLELGRSLARVRWDPGQTRLSAIARFLDGLGYPVHPFRGGQAEALRRREDRDLLIRVAVAGALAGNVMLLAAALYSGELSDMGPEVTGFLRWLSFLLAIPAVLWAGSPFWRGAVGSLRAGVPHLDLPVTLGLAAGLGWGAHNTITNQGEIYFDSVCALVFLLLIGRWLRLRGQRKAADAAELLLSLVPGQARQVSDDGSVREVPVEALLEGMRVEVRSGETIPVDGRVEAGSSLIDASWLTGESRPRAVAVGDPVQAGTVNLSSALRVRVEGAGETTRLGRLMRQVEEHAARHAPMVELANRLVAGFVVTVLLLAAVTLLLWLHWDPSQAVEHTMALLIITCPCALGLATPLAYSVALGRAARAGMLIKGGEALERCCVAGRLWLDKTGTLTEGRLRLVRWHGPDWLKPAVAALEQHDSHPIAEALTRDLGPAANITTREVQRLPAGGIAGLVDGRRIAVGSPVALGAEAADGETGRALAELLAAGLTPLVVTVEGEPAAVVGLGDTVRQEAASVVDRLTRLGFQPGILSGDHQAVVDRVGGLLQLEDGLGGCSPEDKLREVTQAAERGPVVMVGDGVNDAAALAAATLGIAVHGGAEAGMQAADIYLERPGLGPLVGLFEGARRTRRVVIRNLVFSLSYNVVGATLAMAGLVHPLLAAVLMPLSSLTVIASSYRARTFVEER